MTEAACNEVIQGLRSSGFRMVEVDNIFDVVDWLIEKYEELVKVREGVK
jgi:hypothetical protein